MAGYVPGSQYKIGGSHVGLVPVASPEKAPLPLDCHTNTATRTQSRLPASPVEEVSRHRTHSQSISLA